MSKAIARVPLREIIQYTLAPGIPHIGSTAGLRQETSKRLCHAFDIVLFHKQAGLTIDNGLWNAAVTVATTGSALAIASRIETGRPSMSPLRAVTECCTKIAASCIMP